ncbi:MAG: 3-deoxy-7-phosphoheptulonate synthase [Candidatus Omnitrophica bacterium]|nr:3-deoxy-7-phosphoheptulonate synthase [Candidatus Omnitrophota bacterium]MCG2703965.1 3-deoxy-7-phosphoheptulonate synthase [Candidatus Omnitrophota bacterium]
MIIVLRPKTREEDKNRIIDKIHSLGLKTMVSQGVERTIIGVIGEEDILRVQPMEAFPGVEKVIPVLAPYKLVSREFKPEDSVIKVKGVDIGAKRVVVMAGPCAIENLETLRDIATAVRKSGALILRGGAFKPRTSPYSFQGLGLEGLKIMKEVADELGLLSVTEVIDPRDVELVVKYADIMQIGARNMQNFNLLKEAGKSKKPVLLKRGMMSTIKEFLMSAEYILSEGNFNVILCERGIRTFETYTRNTLDINAVPAIKMLSHLPIIVDPSHATGKWGLVCAVSRAAIAAGADGLIVEVHTHPEQAASDGEQSLNAENFDKMVKELTAIARAVGREI